MLSAALTRTEAGAPASTMIFIRVAATALVACCNRAIDWPNACRRDSRDTAANSVILSQRRSALVPIPPVRERIETAVEAAGGLVIKPLELWSRAAGFEGEPSSVRL